jgi:hypothetical protein
MTTFKQEFNFDGVPVQEDGSTLLTMQDWALTLSTEDKAAYDAAEESRVAAVQQQVDLGNLTIEEDTGFYIWAAGADTDVVVLPEWEIFFNRFNTENNITFSESRVDL